MLFSENGFDGLRIRDRPLSTLLHELGDGTGDVDFEPLLVLAWLSLSGDPFIIL